jgi:hypothetical protein
MLVVLQTETGVNNTHPHKKKIPNSIPTGCFNLLTTLAYIPKQPVMICAGFIWLMTESSGKLKMS